MAKPQLILATKTSITTVVAAAAMVAVSAVALTLGGGMMAVAALPTRSDPFLQHMVPAVQAAHATGQNYYVVDREGRNYQYPDVPSRMTEPTDVPHDGYILVFGESLAQQHRKITDDLRSKKIKGDFKKLYHQAVDRLKLIQLNQKAKAAAVIAKKRNLPVAAVERQMTAELIAVVNGAKFTGELSNREILDLQAINVLAYPDVRVSATLDATVPLIEALRLDTDGNDCLATGNKCLDGAGVRIGIIDSGIDYTHPDLGGCFGMGCKVAGGFNYVNPDSPPLDDHGHGTHVAGIVAGLGELNGVAPEATLYAYKVLRSDGRGTSYDTMRAVEAAVDPNDDGDFSDRLDILNLSIGAPFFTESDPMLRAVDSATDAGTIVVVAAGNSGPGGQPDCFGRGEDKLGSVCSPAVSSKVIAVGATYTREYVGNFWGQMDPRRDMVTSFSSRGPAFFHAGPEEYGPMKPDVVAPGALVCAARYDTIFPPGSHKYYAPCHDEQHVQLAGTSIAAPVVTGAAALLKEKNPNWRPATIKSALRSSAQSLAEPLYRQGFGRINVRAALSIPTPVEVEVDYARITLTERTLELYGRINGDRLVSYQIASGHGFAGGEFQPFVDQALTAPVEGLLYRGPFDALSFGNSPILFQVTARDAAGRTGSDIAHVRREAYAITAPRSNDVLRAGEQLVVRGRVSDAYTYTIEYAPLWDAVWHDDNVVVARNGDVLGTWDTTSTAPGYYNIRIIFTYRNATGVAHSFSHQISEIYLDPTLKPGWPKYIALDTEQLPFGTVLWPGGYLEPVVADLDGDGRKEIIVARDGLSRKLFVFRESGELAWDWELTLPNEAYGAMPVVSDLDNDGNPNIILLSNSTTLPGETDVQYYLHVFSGNGTVSSVVNQLPFRAQSSFAPVNVSLSTIVSDLDFDGNKEIVVKNNWSHYPQFMKILNAQGNVIRDFTFPPTKLHALGGSGSYPAVGDFDEDNDLEIVVAQQSANAGPNEHGEFIFETTLYVYNLDGSLVAGWPQNFIGLPFSSPVVGDIDNNGEDDIVLAVTGRSGMEGKIYALDRRGGTLAGWPQENGHFLWAAPALLDANDDGFLEIAVASNTQVELYSHRGTLLFSSPTSFSNEYGIVSGDVDGDGRPDVLINDSQGLFGNIGRSFIAGWSASGKYIPSVAKVSEASLDAPLVIDDIDRDGKVEIIGSARVNYERSPYLDKFRSSIYVWNLGAAYHPEAMPWPRYQRDLELSGRYASKFMRFSRGDANADGAVNLSDAVFLLANLFQGGPNASCEDAADANDDGYLDISDVIFLLKYLFVAEALPLPPPGPQTPGPDPTADVLGCAQYPAP